jgi:hypothetical protein
MIKSDFNRFLLLLIVLTFISAIIIFPTVLAVSTPVKDVQLGAYKIYNNGQGDTYDPAWADDDNLYCAGNDGYGFGSSGNSSNINFNKLTGNDYLNLTGTRVNDLISQYGTSGQTGPDGRTWKSSGVICLNGTLYMVVGRHMYTDSNYGNRQSAINASIVKSTDKGLTWTRTATENYNSPMFPGMRFSTPYFIYYGKDGAASVDNANNYIYAISNNGFWDNGDNYILGRVLRASIGNLSASDWQFFKGGDGMLDANWSSDMNQASLMITAPGQCGETGATYIPALDRYILVAWYYPIGNGHGSNINQTKFAFYESPKPWGPWTKVCECVNYPQGWYCPRLLSKWQTQNGVDVDTVLVTAGDWSSSYYRFTVVPVKLKTTVSSSTWVNDDAPGMTYSAGWSDDNNRPAEYNGDLHCTSGNGNYVQYTFTGTGVDWVNEKAFDLGNVDVYLDNMTTPVTTVSCYNATRVHQQIIYSASGLSNGSHTIKLVKKDAAWMSFDALKVYTGVGATPTPTPTPTPGGSITTVDDNTTGTGTNQFEYVGSWSMENTRSNAYNSTEHFSVTNNDYLQVRFSGTRIKFYSSKAYDMGMAAFSIDGGTETVQDFYNSTRSGNN